MNKQEIIINIDEDIKKHLKQGGFIGLAQINAVAGDIEGNSNKIINYIKAAELNNLDLIIFPLNTIIGHEMNDVLDRFPFLLNQEEKYLNLIVEEVTNITVLLPLTASENSYKFAILRNKKVDKIIYDKDMITSKEIHDGAEFYIKPIYEFSRAGSQYRLEESLKELAKTLNRPIMQINRVGSVDGYSYSGQCCACDETGNIYSRGLDFEEQLLIVNPFNKIGKIYSNTPQKQALEFTLDYDWDLERIYKSSIQTIKDYFSTCSLKRCVLGLSGGLDSSICAVLLTDALGKENVYGISMPSKLTSDLSKTDAYELAKNLGINFAEAPIKAMHDTIDSAFKPLFDKINSNWKGRYKESYTSDNIQARSRAIYLWGIANEFSSCIPIATSDKSELYMGYATINGDMSGGFAPIADITKTKLFAFARWLNSNRDSKNVIPQSVINKKPGAELAIDPNTGNTLNAEDALMPYEFLDEIIWRIENKQENYNNLLQTKFLYEQKNNITNNQKIEWLDKFYKRMYTSIYKGFILPPATILDAQSILKVDYRQPITINKIKYNDV